jgi:hypothetical protein
LNVKGNKGEVYMRLPPFDRSSAKCHWDRYRAFYNERDGFVQFETGEVIVSRTSHLSSENERHYNNRYDVRFFYPADTNRPSGVLWDPKNNQKVLRSWLPQAGLLMLDCHTKRVVHPAFNYARKNYGLLNREYDSTDQISEEAHKNPVVNPGIPSRFNGGAAVYWAGPGHEPVTTGTITYSPPDKLTSEEAAQLKEKLIVIKTADRLAGNSLNTTTLDYHTFKEIEAFATQRIVLATDVSAMSPEVKRYITVHGVRSTRLTVETPWLEMRAEG